MSKQVLSTFTIKNKTWQKFFRRSKIDAKKFKIPIILGSMRSWPATNSLA